MALVKRIPKGLTPHTVHVEPVLPDQFGAPGGYGPLREVPDVQVNDVALTEASSSGAVEVVSSARVGGNAGSGDYLFQIGDRVTLWQGTVKERQETVQRIDFAPATGHFPAQQVATLT